MDQQLINNNVRHQRLDNIDNNVQLQRQRQHQQQWQHQYYNLIDIHHLIANHIIIMLIQHMHSYSNSSTYMHTFM